MTSQQTKSAIVTEAELRELAKKKSLHLSGFRMNGERLFFIRRGPAVLCDGESFNLDEVREILLSGSVW